MPASSALFQPVKLGKIELKHRVVLAPLTRLRTTPAGVLKPIAKEYYEQRASTPGTLLIAEGTMISEKASGFPGIPGIWTEEQITGWKEVVEAVHDKGSYIFLQIFAMGRLASEQALKQVNPGFEVVGPSDDFVNLIFGPSKPRAMRADEIKEVVQMFADAAKRAIEAGFDGVELHGANGFLIDQFLQDVSNHRQDEYGGSVEKRSRFGLEVVDAVAKAIGRQRTAIKLSPWNTSGGMGMKDPIPQFSHFVAALKRDHPDLAYIHVVEPRVAGYEDLDPEKYAGKSNDFIREIWSPLPIVSAGGWTRELGIAQAEKHPNEAIAYGRHFIANPDLPKRLEKNLPLNPYNRDTFYTTEKEGYIDYPFADA